MTTLSALIGVIRYLIWLAKCFLKSPYQRTVREVYSNHDNDWFLVECLTKEIYDPESRKREITIIREDESDRWAQCHTIEQILENEFLRNPHKNLRTWYLLWLKLQEKTSSEQIFVGVVFVVVFFAGRWSV